MTTTELKDGLTSKTIVAGIASYLTTLLATFGVHVNLQWWVPVVVGVATLGFTIYGRIKATKGIGSFLGLVTVNKAKKRFTPKPQGTTDNET